MARRFVTRIGAIRANRFAETYFHSIRAIRLRSETFAQALVPRNAVRRTGVQFENPETIDPRESANRFTRIGPSKLQNHMGPKHADSRALVSGVRKRVVSQRVVLADVPGPPKTGTRVLKPG